ncbi:MAG: recombinase family protein [Verrucomicrobia bacterium]|nr:recombinase family protein [Verrucomicrobiota bacterium]
MKTERNEPKNGKRYVSYFRVSTKRQGQSGLGLDAQRKMVTDFTASNGGEVVAEFVEVESGKRNDRPQMALALERCKREGLTLLVAKLDRLARNVYFVASLQNAKVDFVCVDNPSATPFVINILASVAENEANAIASRVKGALEQAKARGTILGNPRWQESVQKARDAKSAVATERNGKLLAIVREIQSKTGLTKLAELAEALNLRGIKTARGNAFTSSHVWNLLQTA